MQTTVQQYGAALAPPNQRTSLRFPFLLGLGGLVVAFVAMAAQALFFLPHFKEIQKLMVSEKKDVAGDLANELGRTLTSPGFLVSGGIGIVGMLCFSVGSLWITFALMQHLFRDRMK